MREFIVATALTLLAAVPAHAISYTVYPGAPDPGSAFLGQSPRITFDFPNAPGWSYSNIFVAQGTSSASAQPALDTTKYGYVGAFGGDGVVATFPNQPSISFYWGSVDPENQLEVWSGSTILLTLNGSAIPPASGNQFSPQTNVRINLVDLSVGISKLVFRTADAPFEFDTIAGGIIVGVPEPASWAMMIAGFGMVGAAARRRRWIAALI